MRLVVGSALVVRASSTLWAAPPVSVTTIASACLAGSGILLIPGLWTPIAGTLVALVAMWQILTQAGDPWISLLAGTIGGGLALLGPGFWSVDSYLFGWKRVAAPNSRASFAQASRERPPKDLAAGSRDLTRL
jgi:putative oxidoreductase